MILKILRIIVKILTIIYKIFVKKASYIYNIYNYL